MYITVSGPASSGKGTISRSFAQQFGLVHVDAGLIFRWIAYVCRRKDALTESNLRILEKNFMQYRWDGKRGSVEYGGELIDLKLADPEIASLTSKLASDPKYFTHMTEVTERIISSFPAVIVDGRSAGTALLPNADMKFYIDAPIHIRVARRLSDLAKINEGLVYEDVFSQLLERDSRDKARSTDPLRIPQGASIIDSGSMSVSDAVTYMHQEITNRGFVLEEAH